MRRLLIKLSTACLFGMSATTIAGDFETAVSRHAQASARDVLVEWINARADGQSWNSILREKVPQRFDDVCGYRALVRLPDSNFQAAKREIVTTVGDRNAKAFGALLSRPGAKLSLVGTRTKGMDNEDQALVTLQVMPARPGDIRLSLLMELGKNGEMILCDLVPNENLDNGILRKLGNELDL